MLNSKNMPSEVAEYFKNGRRKIASVTANDDFTLSIGFDNGEIRLFDMSLNLEKNIFSPFRDLSNFKRVYIDDCGCIAWDINPNIDSNHVWENKVDLCSDSCYIYSKEAGK